MGRPVQSKIKLARVALESQQAGPMLVSGAPLLQLCFAKSV
jgi:hypothetical protein